MGKPGKLIMCADVGECRVFVLLYLYYIIIQTLGHGGVPISAAMFVWFQVTRVMLIRRPTCSLFLRLLCSQLCIEMRMRGLAFSCSAPIVGVGGWAVIREFTEALGSGQKFGGGLLLEHWLLIV